MKFTIGIDVGGTNLRVGVVSPIGKIVYVNKQPTPNKDQAAFLQRLIELIKDCQERFPGAISGLGIGWPGPVDIENGLILETPNISIFKSFALKSYLEKNLGLSVFLDNDAKCAGLAELKFGVARGLKEFILLTFGTGIGGAVFTNGQLVRGKSGLAGEIGHLCLYPHGIACSCGSLGCFEKYCSAIALERRATEKIGRNISAKEILAEVASNDGLKSLLTEYVEDLAVGLGSLINIFDPQAIVFSGGLFTSGGQNILRALQEKLSKQGFQSLKQHTELKATELEGQAGIIGAASLGF